MKSRDEFLLLLDSCNFGQRSRVAAYITQASCVIPVLFEHCRVRVIFEKNRQRTVESENISQGSLTEGGVGSWLLVELYCLPGPK